MGITHDNAATGAMIPPEKISFSRNEKEIELMGLVIFDL
jgi:hypothetical protein